MTRPTVVVMARSAAALAAVTLAACGSQAKDTTPEAAVRTTTRTTEQGASSKRSHGVVEDCSTSSEADFPAAFTQSHNVVVGPLALIGAAYTPASTVREFGGNKFPALVQAGHYVTIAVARRARRVASLGYGPLPQGVELSPHDGHPVVTFIACESGEPSGSTADGKPVTFWSGFVLTRTPRCLLIDVWVDDEPSPRRTALGMGVRRCL
jgi:hypothetical protein